MRHKMSLNDVERALHRYYGGESVRAIAGSYGVSDTTIRRNFRRIGVRLREPIEQTADDLLTEIIKYKKRHDGTSPPYSEMVDWLGVPEKRVKNALDNLERQGRIARGPSGTWSAIMVTGGSWTFNASESGAQTETE